jgi:hypothetical protein
VEETGKEYLRPPTPVLRDTYGSGTLFAWGGGDLGCLGHGETDTHVYPKCVDGLRGRQVRSQLLMWPLGKHVAVQAGILV